MVAERMESIGERLISARKQAGFKSARQAALYLGLPYTTYYGYEKETRGLDPIQADDLAKRFKVSLEWLLTGRGQPKTSATKMPVPGMAPILGTVAAGRWLEVDSLNGDPEGFMPLTPGLPHPPDHYFYLYAQGESMNKVFSTGTLLLCLCINKAGISISPNDIAIVERRRVQDGLIETTAKRVKQVGKELQLWPESTDPAFRSPLMLGGNPESETITMTAKVVGWFQTA